MVCGAFCFQQGAGSVCVSVLDAMFAVVISKMKFTLLVGNRRIPNGFGQGSVRVGFLYFRNIRKRLCGVCLLLTGRGILNALVVAVVVCGFASI